jgi:c-di-GMP-binding flagellar brake protein YcgR
MGHHGAILPSSFSELNLKCGDAFSIETLSPAKRYPLRLIGFVEKGSLVVTAPQVQGKSFLLPEDQLLKVRLMASTVACGFSSKVMRTCRAPYLYMHLAYPDKIEAVTVRQASRVQLALLTRIDAFKTGDLPGVWPKKGQIIDLSSGGARILSMQPIAATSSALWITFKLVIESVERIVKVKAVVRNIAEVGKSPEEAAYQYGVQFLDVDDDDKIRIAAYVYEQMSRQGVI